MLRLALLGSPELSLQNTPLTDQITGRGFALLVYLAVTGQQHTRNRLADLLWNDVSNYDALKKVRNILPGLRTILDDHLQIARETAAFNKSSAYWLDVEEFRTYLTSNHTKTNPESLEKILALYRGDFLGDFHIRNAPSFEEWVIQQREDLHQLAVQGFQRLTTYYLAEGNATAGLAASRRLLTIEPWHEEGHRCQMSFLAWNGKRDAALAQYAACQRVLEIEFASEPAPETTTLYEQIRTGAFTKRSRPGNKEQEAEKAEHRAWDKSQAHLTSNLVNPRATPLVNWREIPHPAKFYGRESELQRLTQWLGNGCRLIGIFGLAGQGKTALAAQWIRTHVRLALRPRAVIADTPQEISILAGFQHILWCSVADETPPQIIRRWLQALSEQAEVVLPEQWDQQVSLLIVELQRQRCLLVMDQEETFLPGGEHADSHWPTHKTYRDLLQRVGSSEHQSCLVLLSRESPLEFSRWEEQTPAIRSIQLSGLALDAGGQLLHAYGLTVSDTVRKRLIECYSGNPLALMVVAETIQQLFAGNGERFLAAETFIFDDLRTVLNQQFSRCTPTEREILLHLAIVEMPLSTEALWAGAMSPSAQWSYVEAHRALLRRAWIEAQPGGFGLPKLLQAYINAYLIEEICHELLGEGRTLLTPNSLLNRYLLVNAAAPDSVLTSQAGHLLLSVAKQLIVRLGQANLSKQVQSLVDLLQEQAQFTPKYLHVNLHYLLQHCASKGQENWGSLVTQFQQPERIVPDSKITHKRYPPVEMPSILIAHAP